MVEFNTLSEDVSVAGQVRAEDMAQIADAGFRSIVCNRPDGEEAGQPEWSALETGARRAGLETRFMPIATPEDMQREAPAFAQAMQELPKPILAFCRTGNRCTHLFAAAREVR